MNESTDSLLRMTVAIPPVGDSAVLRKGPLELRLENHRGGLCLLTPRAREAQRHFLGLTGDGWLELTVRAPEHRVRVRLTDRLTLVPGGRLRGYVAVPLPHRLSWCRPGGRVDALLDVAPRELQTSWLGEGPDGGYVHDAQSGFHLDRHGLGSETVALVPIVILNHGESTLAPEELTISVRERDIRDVDGQIVTSPRRLHFGDATHVDERIRSLPRRSA